MPSKSIPPLGYLDYTSLSKRVSMATKVLIGHHTSFFQQASAKPLDRRLPKVSIPEAAKSSDDLQGEHGGTPSTPPPTILAGGTPIPLIKPTRRGRRSPCQDYTSRNASTMFSTALRNPLIHVFKFTRRPDNIFCRFLIRA